jgi:hypothetical protein
MVVYNMCMRAVALRYFKIKYLFKMRESGCVEGCEELVNGTGAICQVEDLRPEDP